MAGSAHETGQDATGLHRDQIHGLLWGFLGVASFSLTLPATRLAVEALDPLFVAYGRALIAAMLAGLLLLVNRSPRPCLADWKRLAVVSAGVVIGFPLFISIAMVSVPASHGAIVIGLLPLTTAAAGCVFAGERPAPAFWGTSSLGAGLVIGFALMHGAGRLMWGDLSLIGAVVAGSVGYAQGGAVAGRLGGWQVICWALVLALPPLAAAAVFITWPASGHIPLQAWAGFAYVTLVSQLAGMFAWYRGLALGGIARVSQTQFLQLFLTLLASSALLGEHIDAQTLAFGAVITGLVAFGARQRIQKPRHILTPPNGRSSGQ
ncbi:MAG: DMT family transporter [Telmatospirillum sp.]|nr:DMT family transporter [Telmatospirillum sp.]